MSYDEEGGAWKDFQLSYWWRKDGQGGPGTTSVTFRASSHSVIVSVRKIKSDSEVPLFCPSLSQRLKQNGPA